ncbi:MAG TPA: trypsin-like serine protease [Chromatiales bacterium]|nr:trypsin-like serine protease [Chromatiales bacterium]
MDSLSIFSFWIRVALTGLVAALVVLWILPEEEAPLRPVVEVHAAAAPAPTPPPAPATYAPAVERAAPAVVNVFTSKTVSRRHPLYEQPMYRQFFGNGLREIPERTQNSLGSGVIFSPHGYVLTNNHVIDGADAIRVLLDDGRVLEAEVVGADEETDLAVLKVPHEGLPSIVVGDSEHLRVGDVVLAIGNPFGVGKTVTQGIVSATGRTHMGISAIENFIQTDAAINPGNSGGALINARGELVGINTAIYSSAGGSNGVGFAIPSHLALQVMKDIVEHGRVIRGWLGVQGRQVNRRDARLNRMQKPRGVLITEVVAGSPAARAGIRPGDLLLSIDGEPVSDALDAFQRIARHKPGDRIEIEGVRAGTPVRWRVTVAERPKFRSAPPVASRR